MKITIIHTDPQESCEQLGRYAEELRQNLNAGNHTVKLFKISEMNLRACSGCWHCWWTSPGICSQKDGAEALLRQYIQSDAVIFIASLQRGFINPDMKKVFDRLIPLYHPHIIIENGQMGHRMRYPKYPAVGVIYQPTQDTDAEDIGITQAYLARSIALFHSKQLFIQSTNFTFEEVSHEIAHL